MGAATDSQICYGVLFEEDYEFPWATEEHDYDIEDWWRKVNNYVNPKWDPYTKEGQYKPGVNQDDPRISEYFAHQRRWEKDNPIPVTLVNVCSADCPIYMLVDPSSVLEANRGYPTAFVPESLQISESEHRAIIEFCNEYGLEYSEGPSWFLSSYWG